MATYSLRKMTVQDYEWVYRLKKNAFKKYVVANWGSWDSAIQRDYFKNFVEKYKDNIFIIGVDNVDVGFYAGNVVGNGNYHIGTIVIDQEHQNKGLGTAVLRDIVRKNKDRNIEVKYFKNNPVGNLYERLGFVDHGESKYHYHVIKWR